MDEQKNDQSQQPIQPLQPVSSGHPERDIEPLRPTVPEVNLPKEVREADVSEVQTQEEQPVVIKDSAFTQPQVNQATQTPHLAPASTKIEGSVQDGSTWRKILNVFASLKTPWSKKSPQPVN